MFKKNDNNIKFKIIHVMNFIFFLVVLFLISACHVFNGQSKIDRLFSPGFTKPNIAPIATNNTLSVALDTPTDGILSATDENINDIITFTIVSQGSLGTVVINNFLTGSYTYTPNASTLGTDTFTFKANDSKLDSNIATVTVTIYDPNVAPAAVDISPAAFDEDVESIITLSYSDIDLDLATTCSLSNLVNVSITQACTCDGSGDCTVGVTGTGNYIGSASFKYTVTANGQTSNSANATLAITAVNDAPVISNIADTSTNEDAAKAISFTISDIDNTLSCATSISMSSTNTALIPDANVSWSGTAPNCTGTITPADDEYGSSDITFTLSDGALSSQDTFTLTVNRLGDDVFSFDWLFDFAGWTDPSIGYTVSNSSNIKVATSLNDISEEVAYLVASDQTDEDDGCNGFGDGVTPSCGGEFLGVKYGTLSDGGNRGLLLDNSGTPTNNAALDESWTPQWDSLMGYWKLDESAWDGTASEVIDSVGVNHGVRVGDATTSNLSKVGTYTGSFDGTGDYTSATFYGEKQNFSVALWAMNTTATPRTYAGMVSNFWPGSNGQFSMGRYAGNFCLGYTYQGVNYNAEFSANDVGENVWHHYAGVFNNGVLKFYKNGIEIAPTGGGCSSSHGAGSFLIGYGYVAASDDYWTGYIDDVALWETSLTNDEIFHLYSRQSAKFSGTFTSRVLDAKGTSSWTNFSWLPTLPWYKELPDYSSGMIQNETSADYSSLVGSTGASGDNDLMSGIIGLWHFNENSWADVANEVIDNSGTGNHGRGKNGSTTTSYGKLQNAGNFDGVDDHVRVTDSVSLNTSSFISVSLWLNTADPTKAWQSILTKGVDSQWELRNHGGIGTVSFMLKLNGVWGCSAQTTTILKANEWYHLLATYDGAQVKIYLNGVLENSQNYTGAIDTTASDLYIGSRSDGLYFKGQIDEVAIWNRPLDSLEAKQIYQRGGARLKHQIRSCNDSACSGESWQGPDGTSESYFSELNNNSIPLTGSGEVKTTLPSMLLSDFTSAPSDNRYFQYRTIFESDSNDITFGPELKSASVDPIHYSQEETIYGNQGVDFYNLNSFVENLATIVGCSAGVVYNLSIDKTNWKYWNGSNWVNSNGSSTQANTAASIHAVLSGDPTKFRTDVGAGSVYFKAYLKSDGLTQCELNDLEIGGSQ